MKTITMKEIREENLIKTKNQIKSLIQDAYPINRIMTHHISHLVDKAKQKVKK